MKKNFLLILFAMCLASPTWAYDLTNSGYAYNIITQASSSSDGTVELTYMDLENPYNFTSTSFGTTTMFVSTDGLYNVVGWGISALEGATTTTTGVTLTIPNAITYLGDRVCKNFTGLIAITMNANNLTSLGAAAFQGCSSLAGSLTIPSGVTIINDSTFFDCSSLGSLTLGSGVTSIGAYAFNGCTSFEAFTIPASVGSIGAGAFANCTGLTEITCNATTPPTLGTDVFAGLDCSKITLHVPSGSETEYQNANQWKDFYTEGALPEPGDPITVDGLTYTVVSVGDDGTGTVEVGSNLEYTGTLSIPSTVVYGGITFTVIGIGDYAFGPTSGYHYNLTSVTIPNTVTYIGSHAFYRVYDMTSIALSDSLERIGDYAFFNTHISSVSIPEKVDSIKTYAFASCARMTSLNLGNVKYIGSYAFNACNYLTNVVIPESVITIADHAFYNLTSLASVTLGSNVQSIGDNALSYNYELSSVTSLNPTPPSIGSNEFTSDNAILYVPAGTLEEYQRVWGTTLSGITRYSELGYAVLKVTLATEDGVGYATYYDDSYDITLPEGYTAYWAESVSNGEVTLTEIEGGVIPANTAVVIAGDLTDYATASATSSTEASTYTGNLLHGQPTTGSIEELEGNYLYYMLTTNTNGTDLGFYWGAADGGVFSSKANKAWLAVPVDGTSPASLSIKFKDKDDETTGISSLEVDGEGNSLNNGAIYTIQGVRVSNMNQPGLYIVDGRKVLVK